MGKSALHLRNKTPLQKRELAMHIYNSMKDNANYPDPKPTMPQLKAGADKVQAKILGVMKAKEALKRAIEEEKRAVKELESLLQRISWYVNYASRGKEEIIRTSGIPAWRKKGKSPLPPALQNLRVKTGKKPGEIILMWKGLGRSHRVYAYPLRYSFSPPGRAKWIIHEDIPTLPTFIFISPKPGQKVWIQIRAQNPTGPGPWSQVIVAYSRGED